MSDFNFFVWFVCIIIGSIAVGTFIAFCFSRSKKRDYRDIAQSAIDIPFHHIDEAKVEHSLMNLPHHEYFYPQGYYNAKRRRGYFVTLERMENQPSAMQFAKAGTVPIRVTYRLAVVKANSWSQYSGKEVWVTEFTTLANALSLMSVEAKPVQQQPVTPPTPAPLEAAVTDIQVIQGRIDVMEKALEIVRDREYANKSLSIADVAVLTGRQDYLDLLKERDELMWKGEQESHVES